MNRGSVAANDPEKSNCCLSFLPDRKRGRSKDVFLRPCSLAFSKRILTHPPFVQTGPEESCSSRHRSSLLLETWKKKPRLSSFARYLFIGIRFSFEILRFNVCVHAYFSSRLILKFLRLNRLRLKLYFDKT